MQSCKDGYGWGSTDFASQGILPALGLEMLITNKDTFQITSNCSSVLRFRRRNGSPNEWPIDLALGES